MNQTQAASERDTNATLDTRMSRMERLKINTGITHFEDYKITICKDPDFASKWGWYIETKIDGIDHPVRSCWEYDYLYDALHDARYAMMDMICAGY